jgi:high-affinity iron transporter
MATAPPASHPAEFAKSSQEIGQLVSGKPGAATTERVRGVARVHVSHGWLRAFVVLGGLAVAALLVWQALTAGGNPNPLAAGASPWSAGLDIGVLVFREGLECVLVLTAVLAGLPNDRRNYQNPIAAGVGLGTLATIATWVIATGIVNDLSGSVSALTLQAVTGLLAVVVLLVVMNWFFHKLYWTGWISMHNQRRRTLMEQAERREVTRAGVFGGMMLLGFTSLYREGFEVVLFLQSYRLKLGPGLVYWGVLAGLTLTAVVAVLTFVAHRRLPYRRMLVFTGVLLGAVLFVMVGEQVQEMQLAHWVSATTIPWLQRVLPDWMGLWFSVFPTVESLAAQFVAAGLVIGSYFTASRRRASN